MAAIMAPGLIRDVCTRGENVCILCRLVRNKQDDQTRPGNGLPRASDASGCRPNQFHTATAKWDTGLAHLLHDITSPLPLE